jgi:hypothetical protein
MSFPKFGYGFPQTRNYGQYADAASQVVASQPVGAGVPSNRGVQNDPTAKQYLEMGAKVASSLNATGFVSQRRPSDMAREFLAAQK